MVILIECRIYYMVPLDSFVSKIPHFQQPGPYARAGPLGQDKRLYFLGYIRPG